MNKDIRIEDWQEYYDHPGCEDYCINEDGIESWKVYDPEKFFLSYKDTTGLEILTKFDDNGELVGRRYNKPADWKTA